jgi:parallel beta-helix repeat protein
MIRNISTFGRLKGILQIIGVTLLVASCGGGPDAGSGSNSAGSTPKYSPLTGTETWTDCATEHGTCTFSGTREVRYGANGAYNYQVATDSVACNNNVFGDPAPGVPKNCAYSNSEAPMPNASWSYCAAEHGTCTFSGTRQVQYGANGMYFYQTATDSIACTNEVFGDPLPGVSKTCNVSNGTSEPPAETWTFCANKHEICSFSGTREVRYGANGTYNYRTATDSIMCSDADFGDPLPGVDKTCDYSSVTSTPTPPNEALPIPRGEDIVNGTTVELQCGQTYHGTLELNGKSNVTVTTVGDCGKASITPGRAISGWIQDHPTLPQVYSAPLPVDFNPMQVFVSGQPVDAAHWPNRPQIWETNPDAVPNSDLDGATLVYLTNPSVIETTTISGNRVDTPHWFYVEGKWWMLDSPGEWVVSNGRLYLWAPDGQSPEDRTWAAPNNNGINVSNSSNITIDGIKIFSAYDGIYGEKVANLNVLNTEIDHSARDGIFTEGNGSSGLTVSGRTLVTNSGRSGINAWYGMENAKITYTRVENTGMVGKPKPTYAAILFGTGRGNEIDNVEVINSGFHGIMVLRNHDTKVTNSLVDTACVRLTDCGGIYTGVRGEGTKDEQGNQIPPLNLRIEKNTVRNVRGTVAGDFRGIEGIAIYLDDFANGVTVTKNIMSNNSQGMVVHDGFANNVTCNTFESNEHSHLTFSQNQSRGGDVYGNMVTHNTFSSPNNAWTYKLETGQDLKKFAAFDHNRYSAPHPDTYALGRTWMGDGYPGVDHTYSDWKNWTGQDANSQMTVDQPSPIQCPS